MPHKSMALFFELVAIAIMGWFFSINLLSPALIPDSFSYTRPELGDGWFMLVNSYSNAITPWRVDPALRWILAYDSPTLFYCTLFSFFCLGTTCLLISQGSKWVKAILFATATGMATLLLFGWDMVVWGSLVWFPWFYCWLNRIWKKPAVTLIDLVILLFLATLLAASANQLALLLVAITTLTTYYLTKPNNLRTVGTTLVVSVLPAIITLFQLPRISFPDYPTHARVILNRSFLPRTDALIGQTAPLQVIDWQFLREILLLPTTILFALAILGLLLSSFRTKARDATQIEIPLILILFFVLLETSFVTEQVTQIAPLHSIARIIPDAIFTPLITVVLASALILTAQQLATWALGNGIVFLGLALLLYSWQTQSITIPYIASGRPEPVWRLLPNDLQNTQKAKYDKVIFSPSLAVVNNFGIDVVNRYDYVRQLDYQPISNFRHRLSASHNSQQAKQIAKTAPVNRWTPGNGKQEGDEWIHLFLPNSLIIRGVKISPGSFHSDFPRGLSILSSTDCKATQKDFHGYKSVFIRQDWTGEVNFTDKGFPFIESEAVVAIPFKEPIEARCILVKQIGKTSKYDWSVSEIKLAAEKIRETE